MKRSFQNRSVEVLEDKRMMAANLIGSGMAAMPAAASALQATSSTAGSVDTGAASASASQNVSGAMHLSSVLSGTGQGVVNLVSRTVNGVTGANLSVHVSGAPANATLDVSVGDTVVGSISTNAHGKGILHLNSALGNADQLLSAISGLSANANVSIGVAGQSPILTGTLQAGANVGSTGATGSSTVAGLTHAIDTLQNGVIAQLNSIIGSLDNAGNGGAGLGAVTNRINHLADRLAGIVSGLTPSAVDSALGNMDASSILGSVYGLVPNDVTGQV